MVDNMDEQERMIQQVLAGLQLPHMPDPTIRMSDPMFSRESRVHFEATTMIGEDFDDDDHDNYQYDDLDYDDNNSDQKDNSCDHLYPTVRILLVSDIDLTSAAALAEYTLLQNNKIFDASRIDICIACGPFCRDEDLLPYFKGKQRINHLQQEEGKIAAALNVQRQASLSAAHATSSTSAPGTSSNSWSSIFFRPPEETAALEGLLTAAISQLESIVCRVIFCPGSSDPLTCTRSNTDPRYTPNSRNIHRRWLPLAPGLGVAGLLFLDTPTGAPAAGIQIKPPPGYSRRRRLRQASYDSIDIDNDPYDEDYDDDDDQDNNDNYHDNDSDNDHDHDDDDYYDDDEGGGFHTGHPVTLTNVYGNKRMGAMNYCKTLEGLIKLAPPGEKQHSDLAVLNTKIAQTILVTNYVQPPLPPTLAAADKHNTESLSGEEEAPINDNIEDTTKSKMPSKNTPWPPKEHKNFVESKLAQDQLALEIASGCSSKDPPQLTQIGNVQIIKPGSLRERGEFTLVDISFVNSNEGEEGSSKPLTETTGPTNGESSTAPAFVWKVSNVEFHNINRLP